MFFEPSDDDSDDDDGIITGLVPTGQSHEPWIQGCLFITTACTASVSALFDLGSGCFSTPLLYIHRLGVQKYGVPVGMAYAVKPLDTSRTAHHMAFR